MLALDPWEGDFPDLDLTPFEPIDGPAPAMTEDNWRDWIDAHDPEDRDERLEFEGLRQHGTAREFQP